MLPSFAAWSHSPLPAAPPPPTQPSSSVHMDNHPKKPRHRHSAFQLAALNELYDKNEHPPLEERTALAERLGMETKTVNSWFQNKRASSKKRHKGSSGAHNAASSSAAQVELPPISALIASVSAPPSLSTEFDDFSDDEHLRISHPLHSGAARTPQQQSLFYAGNPQHRHLFEPDNNSMARKARSRPSAAQTEELRKLYDTNPHPSKEEREELGDRIGMRYQSITNWFQNQRSIAKKRREEEDAQPPAPPAPAAHPKARTFSPFPPAAGAAHPSLAVPPATRHPSLALPPHPQPRPRTQPPSHRKPPPPTRSQPDGAAPARRSPSGSSGAASPRASPYRAHAHAHAHAAPRSRRTRPEPHQLAALKTLFRRTATPSIEERGALALEIGMDVGKVTNWFRNLRQTARKRARREGDGDGDGDGDVDMDVDGDGDGENEDEEGEDGDGDEMMLADDVSLATYGAQSRSVSRAGTPVPSSRSSAASPRTQTRGALRVKVEAHSDAGSEEECEEAVTPSPGSSPGPGGLRCAALEKVGAGARFQTGVRVEDALLLLSFHHHVVH
ncbi:hypothetical protein AcW2_000288 [Taiwanofungus camphoratus]|nr:hypothetical protein AcW2_000288 [Antrodia cinnamomea]